MYDVHKIIYDKGYSGSFYVQTIEIYDKTAHLASA